MSNSSADDKFYREFIESKRGNKNRGLSNFPIKSSENDLLEAEINRLFEENNDAIKKAAIHHLNIRIGTRSVPIIPRSHEWDDFYKRILFFRYYFEAESLFFETPYDKNLTASKILVEELKYEDEHNIKEKVQRDLLNKNLNRVHSKRPATHKKQKTDLEKELDYYFESGFETNNLKNLIKSYHATLVGMIVELEQLEEGLFKESSTLRGRVVTGTGGIEKPDWIHNSNIIKKTDKNLTDTIRGYLGTIYDVDGKKITPERLTVEETLQRMARVERVLGIVSNQLSRFQTESIAHAHRIALGIQVLLAALPVSNVAIAVRVNTLKALAAQSFTLALTSNLSDTVTNKLIRGSSDGWAKIFLTASGKSVLDTIFQAGVSKFLILPSVKPLAGSAIKAVIEHVTDAISAAIVDSFKGATFGEALLNLYNTITNPENLLLSAVNLAAGKVGSKSVDSNAPPTKLGDNKNKTTSQQKANKLPEIFKLPLQKLTVAIGLISSTAPVLAKTQTNKPVPTLANRGANNRSSNTVQNNSLVKDRGMSKSSGENAISQGSTSNSAKKLPSSQANNRATSSNGLSERPAQNNSKRPARPTPSSPIKTPLVIPYKRKRKDDDSQEPDKLEQTRRELHELLKTGQAGKVVTDFIKKEMDNILIRKKSNKINEKDATKELTNLLNLAKEVSGEYRADNLVYSNLNVIRIEYAPTRSNGVPILDRIYFGKNEYWLVEVKGGENTGVGKVTKKEYFRDSNGKLITKTIEGEYVKQGSAEWYYQKFVEMAQHSPDGRRMAEKLLKAAKEGKVRTAIIKSGRETIPSFKEDTPEVIKAYFSNRELP